MASYPSAVVHMDMDTFFVSVERLLDPRLVGKPVIVGGHSDRGVVAACSYETRTFGVRSAMPIRRAKQLCPEAIIISGQHAQYSIYARMVREIVQANVPLVEFASIDEFYCDLTGMDRFFGCWQIAQALRQDIIRGTGLPLSMCLSTTKSTAKIGTGTAKPNGEREVPPGTERAFLAPLHIQKIPGLGPKATQLLTRQGIFTIHDLQQLAPETLEGWLGVWGRVLWHKANGTHTSRVSPGEERKSIGKETTFHTDRTELPFLHATLTRLAERVGHRLRHDGRLATTVTMKLRYSDFSTLTHQQTIPPTDQDLDIIHTAKHLFTHVYQTGRPVRLLGVQVSGLVWGGNQLELYTDRQKNQAVAQAKDKLNDRFGTLSVRTAASLLGED